MTEIYLQIVARMHAWPMIWPRTRSLSHRRAQGDLVAPEGQQQQQQQQIVVLQQSNNAGESFDWLAFKMRDSWALDFETMQPADFR